MHGLSRTHWPERDNKRNSVAFKALRNETIGEINHKYKKCLIYDKARSKRKEDIMGVLSRVESRALLMTARTERLRNILDHYDELVMDGSEDEEVIEEVIPSFPTKTEVPVYKNNNEDTHRETPVQNTVLEKNPAPSHVEVYPNSTIERFETRASAVPTKPTLDVHQPPLTMRYNLSTTPKPDLEANRYSYDFEKKTAQMPSPQTPRRSISQPRMTVQSGYVGRSPSPQGRGSYSPPVKPKTRSEVKYRMPDRTRSFRSFLYHRRWRRSYIASSSLLPLNPYYVLTRHFQENAYQRAIRNPLYHNPLFDFLPYNYFKNPYQPKLEPVFYPHSFPRSMSDEGEYSRSNTFDTDFARSLVKKIRSRNTKKKCNCDKQRYLNEEDTDTILDLCDKTLPKSRTKYIDNNERFSYRYPSPDKRYSSVGMSRSTQRDASPTSVYVRSPVHEDETPKNVSSTLRPPAFDDSALTEHNDYTSYYDMISSSIHQIEERRLNQRITDFEAAVKLEAEEKMRKRANDKYSRYVNGPMRRDDRRKFTDMKGGKSIPHGSNDYDENARVDQYNSDSRSVSDSEDHFDRDRLSYKLERIPNDYRKSRQDRLNRGCTQHHMNKYEPVNTIEEVNGLPSDVEKYRSNNIGNVDLTDHIPRVYKDGAKYSDFQENQEEDVLSNRRFRDDAAIKPLSLPTESPEEIKTTENKYTDEIVDSIKTNDLQRYNTGAYKGIDRQNSDSNGSIKAYDPKRKDSTEQTVSKDPLRNPTIPKNTLKSRSALSENEPFERLTESTEVAPKTFDYESNKDTVDEKEERYNGDRNENVSKNMDRDVTESKPTQDLSDHANISNSDLINRDVTNIDPSDKDKYTDNVAKNADNSPIAKVPTEYNNQSNDYPTESQEVGLSEDANRIPDASEYSEQIAVDNLNQQQIAESIETPVEQAPVQQYYYPTESGEDGQTPNVPDDEASKHYVYQEYPTEIGPEGYTAEQGDVQNVQQYQNPAEYPDQYYYQNPNENYDANTDVNYQGENNVYMGEGNQIYDYQQPQYNVDPNDPYAQQYYYNNENWQQPNVQYNEEYQERPPEQGEVVDASKQNEVYEGNPLTESYRYDQVPTEELVAAEKTDMNYDPSAAAYVEHVEETVPEIEQQPSTVEAVDHKVINGIQEQVVETNSPAVEQMKDEEQLSPAVNDSESPKPIDKDETVRPAQNTGKLNQQEDSRQAESPVQNNKNPSPAETVAPSASKTNPPEAPKEVAKSQETTKPPAKSSGEGQRQATARKSNASPDQKETTKSKSKGDEKKTPAQGIKKAGQRAK